MRRYIPSLLIALAALAPFPLAGCDLINKLKGGGADAGEEAAVVATLPDAAAVAVADAGATPAATTTALPTAPVVRPVVVTDGGAKIDAAMVDAGVPVPVIADAGTKTDAGPAPAPTPTLKFPTLFDGGAFKFDAGGFKPPWVK